jgi:hypothetical protein
MKTRGTIFIYAELGWEKTNELFATPNVKALAAVLIFSVGLLSRS